MTSLPYFNLYVGDEAAETAHLSAEEHGAYHRLRCHHWRHDGLPDDDERLRRITGVEPDRWPEVRTAIQPLFTEGWSLPSLNELRERSEAKHAKLVEAGKKGGRPRKPEKPGLKPQESEAYSDAKAGLNPGHNPGLSNQHQMKNSAYEGEVLTRTHAPAREAPDPFVPAPPTKADATAMLRDLGVFPGDFDTLVPQLMRGELRQSALERAAS